MSETNNETVDQQEAAAENENPSMEGHEPTAEEIAAYKEMRIKAKEALEEEIPFLEVEAKYHELRANIEESKAREYRAIGIQAQMFAAPPPPSKNPESDEPQEETPPPVGDKRTPMPDAPGAEGPRKLKVD